MVTRSVSLLERAAVAVLGRLLPVGFRDRQRAEWSADLADLASEGGAVRWRYLLAAAWTLPALRSLVRRGRPGGVRLSGHGVRVRLGRPGTSGIVVLAVLVAMLGGFFGAGAATRIGWEFAQPLPSGAQAEEVARTVFPAVPVAGGGDAPFWTFSSDGEYVEPGSAAYVVETSNVTDLVSGVRDRLAAAGWRLDDTSAENARPGRTPTQDDPVRATRDGITLTYAGGDTFTVARSVPSWLWWFAGGGAVLGALIGWLLTGWAGQRAEQGSVAGQLAGLVAWPTVVVMLVLLLGDLLFVPGSQSWPEMFYLHLLYIVGGTPRWGGLVVVVALGIVAILGRRKPA
ncbi:hypothetical protein [Actinoplanes sp. NPDC020271]|uniref:hypothetical protein n=1 Tax=Actinoplanes sp. NPDC020271 TaxID=3363896 RepID=UPI0037BCE351